MYAVKFCSSKKLSKIKVFKWNKLLAMKSTSTCKIKQHCVTLILKTFSIPSIISMMCKKLHQKSFE